MPSTIMSQVSSRLSRAMGYDDGHSVEVLAEGLNNQETNCIK